MFTKSNYDETKEGNDVKSQYSKREGGKQGEGRESRE